MGRQRATHIRMKPAAGSDLYCGANKIARFTAELESVGPRAKGGTCAKCIKNRYTAMAATAAEE